MKSYVVVIVEGGLVQDVLTHQGDEPGVVEPTVVDWDNIGKNQTDGEDALRWINETLPKLLALPRDIGAEDGSDGYDWRDRNVKMIRKLRNEYENAIAARDEREHESRVS